MDTTSPSLLERLRQLSDQEAWARFVKLYTPRIYSCARRLGLSPDDAVDLVQDVFTVLVQKIQEFTYDRHKSFRGWLRTVTVNKFRENRRRAMLPLASDASPSDLAAPDETDAFVETEYRQYLVSRALELMQAEFHSTTWRACWECVVNGRSAADVAEELGITVKQRCRIH